MGQKKVADALIESDEPRPPAVDDEVAGGGIHVGYDDEVRSDEEQPTAHDMGFINDVDAILRRSPMSRQ